ncbi:hypothetical protein GLOIN_2v1479550 [Rhizophagus clarus]|uniref:Uncharacterized protein n=1 Tax=Rhizophagus clarus TaxID=94130 RepID=A0A8H3M5F7_9GLOM|nr:hypothetical protein GLOIN_2v1479550 [Rhizophagus clarus]
MELEEMEIDDDDMVTDAQESSSTQKKCTRKSTTEKSSSKKKKTSNKDDVSSMLKKLIKELLTNISDSSEEEANAPDELKPSGGKDGAKALVKEEVRKQIPKTKFSDDALRKRMERAGKVYKLFNSIGRTKIAQIRSFPARSILNLSDSNVDRVLAGVLRAEQNNKSNIPLQHKYDNETPEMWCSRIRGPFRKILEENPEIFSKNGYIRIVCDSLVFIPERLIGDFLYRDGHLKRCITRVTSSIEYAKRKEILQAIDRRKFQIWKYKQYILQEEAEMKRLQLELLSQSTPHSKKDKLASVSYDYKGPLLTP